MRRRNLRILLFVSLIIVLSVLTLSFDNIDLPGDGLDRGGSGTGPLGLKLGLDLDGGTHLVYQAETPAVADVTFESPVALEELNSLLEETGHTNAVVSDFDKEQFTIRVPGLTAEGEVSFRQGLEEQLGFIQDFGVAGERATQLELILPDSPDEAAVKGVLEGLGHTEAEVATQGGGTFSVSLPSLDEDGEEALRVALEELIPLSGFTVITGETTLVINITFHELPNETAIKSALEELGFGQATVTILDGRIFAIGTEVLDDETLAGLERGLKERLVTLEEVSGATVDVAVVAVTFQTGQDSGEMELVLVDLGFTKATITESRGTEYTISAPSLTIDQEERLVGILGERLAAVRNFNVQRDNPSREQMEGVVDIIERRVDAFGVSEPIVQIFGDDRVIVQLPGAGDANIDVTFRGQVLEADLVAVLEELGQDEPNIVRFDSISLLDSDSHTIFISDLTAEKQDLLRAGLEEQIGPVESFEVVDEAAGQVQITFGEFVHVADLQSTLEELEFAGAIVILPLGSEFRIRVPPLATGDQERLRQDLAERVAPIQSYEVSGGVEEAKALIRGTAQLVFKERTCFNFDCSQFTDTGAVGDKGEELTGAHLKRAFADTNPTTGVPIIRFSFDGTGTRIFRELTTRIEGNTTTNRDRTSTQCIATFLDEEELICPQVDRRIISGDGFIEGPDFTFDRVQTLAIQLGSGSLPLSLRLVKESTVDALFGKESLRASLKAGLLGVALIALFMLVYYRMSGLVAAIALVIYAVIVLAIFKMIPVTLTLSGLAGLIISIGMAVDANILIFERLKEELRTGRSLRSAMEIGFRRAWPAIRDSNVSTFITCGVLFYFGRELGEPRIIGFAVTLSIGVAVSMFTALTVSRNLLQLLVLTPVGHRLNLFTPEPLQRPMDVAGGER